MHTAMFSAGYVYKKKKNGDVHAVSTLQHDKLLSQDQAMHPMVINVLIRAKKSQSYKH